MKRPLWSILTAAVAALLPGMAVQSSAAVAAPVPEALGPAPEAVQARRPEIRHDERQLDERDENPAPEVALDALHESTVHFATVATTIPQHLASPDVAPRARRSLGRPRVRAPDHVAV